MKTDQLRFYEYTHLIVIQNAFWKALKNSNSGKTLLTNYATFELNDTFSKWTKIWGMGVKLKIFIKFFKADL